MLKRKLGGKNSLESYSKARSLKKGYDKAFTSMRYGITLFNTAEI